MRCRACGVFFRGPTLRRKQAGPSARGSSTRPGGFKQRGSSGIHTAGERAKAQGSLGSAWNRATNEERKLQRLCNRDHPPTRRSMLLSFAVRCSHLQKAFEILLLLCCVCCTDCDATFMLRAQAPPAIKIGLQVRSGLRKRNVDGSSAHLTLEALRQSSRDLQRRLVVGEAGRRINDNTGKAWGRGSERERGRPQCAGGKEGRKGRKEVSRAQPMSEVHSSARVGFFLFVVSGLHIAFREFPLELPFSDLRQGSHQRANWLLEYSRN